MIFLFLGLAEDFAVMLLRAVCSGISICCMLCLCSWVALVTIAFQSAPPAAVSPSSSCPLCPVLRCWWFNILLWPAQSNILLPLTECSKGGVVERYRCYVCLKSKLQTQMQRYCLKQPKSLLRDPQQNSSDWDSLWARWAPPAPAAYSSLSFFTELRSLEDFPTYFLCHA